MYHILKVVVQKRSTCRGKSSKQLRTFFRNGAGRRSKTSCGVGLSAGVLTNLFQSDHDKPYNEVELEEKYVNRGELDWKERLELMWRSDRYDRLSPELEFCKTVGTVAFFTGMVFGAFRESRTVFMKFMASNKQTIFKHPREAQAILQEQVTYHMLRRYSMGRENRNTSFRLCHHLSDSTHHSKFN